MKFILPTILLITLAGCKTLMPSLPERPSYMDTEDEIVSIKESQVDEAAASVRATRELLLPDNPEEAYDVLEGAEKALPEPSPAAMARWVEIATEVIEGKEESLKQALGEISAKNHEIAELKKQMDIQRDEYEKSLTAALKEKEIEEQAAAAKNILSIRKMLAKSCFSLGGLFLISSFCIAVFAKHFRIAAIAATFGVCVISLGYFGAMLPMWAVVVIGLSIFLPVPFLMVWTYNKGLFSEPDKDEMVKGELTFEEVKHKVDTQM